MPSSNHIEQISQRRIIHRTQGHRHGPITRLMSPSDLGQVIKPFVFLDIFHAKEDMLRQLNAMPLHPHSGIATVTVFTEGSMHYHDPENGSGTLGYGGVEWACAGSGMWHGKELTPANVTHIQGFQLWIALPEELENGDPVNRYIEAPDIPTAGPAHVMIGNWQEKQSPVPAPLGINYLLVTLKAGEQWQYVPPEGHRVAWLAVAKGVLKTGDSITSGEMVVFEEGENGIVLNALEDAVFVLGSASPHPYPLHLGSYSVHTSAEALQKGEQRIVELGQKLKEAGNRSTSSGTIPVFR